LSDCFTPLQLFSELWYEFQQLIAIMILIYCVKYTLHFRTITFNLQVRKCPLDLQESPAERSNSWHRYANISKTAADDI